jgi:hypothetical protein
VQVTNNEDGRMNQDHRISSGPNAAGVIDTLELCSNVSMTPAGSDIGEYY